MHDFLTHILFGIVTPKQRWKRNIICHEDDDINTLINSYFSRFFGVTIWLVVYLPLWQIWIGQLGSVYSQYSPYGKIIQLFQTTNQLFVSPTHPPWEPWECRQVAESIKRPTKLPAFCPFWESDADGRWTTKMAVQYGYHWESIVNIIGDIMGYWHWCLAASENGHPHGYLIGKIMMNHWI